LRCQIGLNEDEKFLLIDSSAVDKKAAQINDEAA
jgi:hypothetical protein